MQYVIWLGKQKIIQNGKKESSFFFFLINRKYIDVEKQFQVGHYDKVVTTLRTMNKDNVQIGKKNMYALNESYRVTVNTSSF